MKKIVRAVLVVAILVGGVLAVGATLPVEHTASVTRTFDQSIGPIWIALTNTGGYPIWRSDVSTVVTVDGADGLKRWTERGPSGEMTFEVTEMVPGDSMVVRIVDDGLPFGGQWTYRVEEGPAGTLLTIREDGEIYSPFFRFVSRFILGYTRTMEGVLADLEAHLNRRSPAQ